MYVYPLCRLFIFLVYIIRVFLVNYIGVYLVIIILEDGIFFFFAFHAYFLFMVRLSSWLTNYAHLFDVKLQIWMYGKTENNHLLCPTIHKFTPPIRVWHNDFLFEKLGKNSIHSYNATHILINKPDK